MEKIESTSAQASGNSSLHQNEAETSHGELEKMSQPRAITDEDSKMPIHNVDTLNEVRSSLQTMSAGVEELVTSVKDLLGLSSDSDSDKSDCSHLDNGERIFSWHKFKKRAHKRRQRRRQLEERPPYYVTSVQQGAVYNTENYSGQASDISQKPHEVMTGVRDCNFEEFKTRRPGHEYKLQCTDVLLADDSLGDEIKAFEEIVRGVRSGKITSWRPGQSSKPTLVSEIDSKKWIRRIRVNSPAVLKTLRHVCKDSDDFGREGPTVFYQPFQILVHRLEDMKAQLDILRRLRAEEKKTTDRVGLTLDRCTTQGYAHDDTLQEVFKDKAALDELACFVDFMETRILPDARRYRDPTSPETQTIRYEDLWYLYKPGDLIYVLKIPTSRFQIKSSPSAHSFFRVLLTSLTATSPKRAASSLQRPLFSGGWSMIVQMIDHNGTSYASVPIIWEVNSPFRGEKKVTDLECYPISYLKNGPELLAQAQSDGAKVLSLHDRRFGSYSGWTQTSHALGSPLRDSPAERSRYNSPEHIEGDVLVDYRETINAFPIWKMPFLQNEMEADTGFRSKCASDDLDTLLWSDAGQTY